MLQITGNYWSGDVKLEQVCAPSVRRGAVVVRLAHSLISSGTERMKVEQAQMSLVGKARARPDQVQQVMRTVAQEGIVATYRKVTNRLKTPVPLGYSAAGVVIAVGEDAQEFRVGDRVACAGSSANHAEYVVVPKNLCVRVPDEVSLEAAACTTVAAIALQGLRQAELKLGETSVVLGLGLVGQLLVQFVAANGCRALGLDLRPERLELACSLGATWAGDPRNNAEEQVRALTGGLGADVVFLAAAASNAEPAQLATRLVRDRGRIVDIGKTALQFPWELAYEKELDVRMSRSYGPGRYDPIYEERGVDYPAAYVRWTEKRNMEAVLDMMRRGVLRVEPIISARVLFRDAETAYASLLEDNSALAILLSYQAESQTPAPRIEVAPARVTGKGPAPVRVGVIGAGNFCKSMLLPHLKKNQAVELRTICTSTGLSASDTARRFGFRFATTDAAQIINDPEITTVLIATRHDMHAQFAAAALTAGKRVFVEKPLALRREEVENLRSVCSIVNPALMVGYNRRFAPLVQKLATWMRVHRDPWILTYRVNAGSLPPGHWQHDSETGGGRLLGEVCHFVDLSSFLFGCHPERVHAQSIYRGSGIIRAEENAIYTLSFPSGSVAQIVYCAEGDRSVGKERIEILGNGAVAVLDNFSRLEIAENGKKRVFRKLMPDKGHKAELDAFVCAIANGRPMPIPLYDIFITSEVCFSLQDSLREDTIVTVPAAVAHIAA